MGALAGELARDLLDAVLEFVDGEFDEPPRLGLPRPNPLARHHEPRRAPTAHVLPGALRPAAAGEEAEIHLGEAELRLRVRHAQVARERDLEAAAEAVTVDRGDDRDGCPLDQVGDGLDAGRALAVGPGLLEASDVGARRECPFPLAAQDDDARALAEIVVELSPQRLDDAGVDRIHRRIVEPDGLDRGSVGHASVTPPSQSRHGAWHRTLAKRDEPLSRDFRVLATVPAASRHAFVTVPGTG